jgi:type II secretory pathway pseudopilin PulG
MTIAVPSTERRREAGFTLLMVVFLVAVMSITALAVAPNLLTEGRREKEADTIWRGEQYQRAILLYYRKFGKYPTKIEDLTKQTNGVRFLRQAYTDPMNKDDGSWRFIYVGPNGQLIGSLRPTTLLQNALSPQGTAGLSLLTGGAQSILGAPGAPGAAVANSMQTPGIATNGQQQFGVGTANPLESQPQPLAGAVLGGNIIGVGSKIKKPSLKVYMGGDTYEQWEFIANTTGLQTVLPAQAPVNPNANPNGAPTGADPNAPGAQPPPPVIPPATSPAPAPQ